MTEFCKNCNEAIAVNFCSNCGQKRYKRIDKKYIMDEIQYTVLHTNKGLLFSIKKIIKNPGKSAREFLEGNRVNHYKPILLVFVLSGISTFLSYKVLGFKEIMTSYFSAKHMDSKFTAEMMSFLSSYNAIIMLALIPVFALITKIAFRKWGQNYYEHVIMNAFFVSFYTLATIILMYPILYFAKNISATTFFNITQLGILLVPLLLVWFFKEFYKEKPLKTIIIRVLFIILLTLLAYVLAIILGIIIGIIYMAIANPEALKNFKPK